MFWLIFITLMVPREVRIVPTYAVAANAFLPFQTLLDLSGITWLVGALSCIEIKLAWNLLNFYAGLIMPLVATATATLLYRQFLLTIPEELGEAAMMDGSGPLRFLWDVLIPLSRTDIAALATIMFVYAWNQYLWPLLVITDQSAMMIAVELSRLVPKFSTTVGEAPKWHIAIAGTVIVMLPPFMVVLLMQRWFMRGLINTDNQETAMATSTITDVRKSDSKTQVVHSVTLAVKTGEFIVILGPSGCGKSTLLRMIAGLESIMAGEISIAGKVVNALEPHVRGCAMVFQNYALYPHMTVAQSIGYGLKVADLPEAERSVKVAKVAASVGLTEYLDRRSGQLSGGQRQRVAMARAIVRKPGMPNCACRCGMTSAESTTRSARHRSL